MRTIHRSITSQLFAFEQQTLDMRREGVSLEGISWWLLRSVGAVYWRLGPKQRDERRRRQQWANLCQWAHTVAVPPCPHCGGQKPVVMPIIYGLIDLPPRGAFPQDLPFVLGGCVVEEATHMCERCDLAFRHDAATHTSVIVGQGDDR